MLNYGSDEKQELKNDIKIFLYERIISIYMKSRQKSWRRFNNLIPEKGVLAFGKILNLCTMILKI